MTDRHHYPLTYSIIYPQADYEKDKSVKDKAFFKGRKELTAFAQKLGAGELLAEELTGSCYYNYEIDKVDHGKVVHWSIHQHWEVLQTDNGLDQGWGGSC